MKQDLHNHSRQKAKVVEQQAAVACMVELALIIHNFMSTGNKTGQKENDAYSMFPSLMWKNRQLLLAW